ncbi:cysteinyl-tRNA synthetase [Thermosipho africanus TCF52B]|uniref:Cysteine--tRNA ligase n=1 Tax=Thermosipho africanus (strain TCF52B) TaxID=484019 RepID=SYC_THEAB|nr:cysteine--tRNA ligase [Thermosipho africanus]B7IFB7.1 RecName: Full=Cysteine--tRNA ligase; AltName: Full=Cysteinyl-tRNA synthetase; Short=CysRS [Thermosipho africanus TCF52B]ACJ74781.1 cysteinyl-tRNA synthetase [Thermosipho africanus TCF52B]
MAIYITNTETGKKEELKTIEPGVVKMYVCGPTVYNYIHIGNARPAVVFDAFRRFLEYRGYKVIMVQNFTDIDDKIINEANEWGVDFKDVADTFIAEYWKDAQSLGIRAANFHPRTTDYVNEIVDAVEKLISKGYAYTVENGDVYFSVKKFERYGKLSGKKIEDLISGARVEVNTLKKDPLDFALWKAVKPGEPSWDSPWGCGRPGWHIECSVMSQKLLGDTFDIHAGGEDLIFPHHEDEKSQSEALTGKPFARYWMHNGMIITRGDKMSKSIGNVFLVREAVKRYGKDAVKLFLLSKHYRTPIEFSDEIMMENKKAALKVLKTLNRFEEKYPYPKVPKRDEYMNDIEQKFVEALEDDFNTPKAIALIFDLSKELNKAMDEGKDDEALKRYHLITRVFGSILGLFEGGVKISEGENTNKVIEEILKVRQEFRKAKNFEAADKIRDALLNSNVKILDTPDGTKWEILEVEE